MAKVLLVSTAQPGRDYYWDDYPRLLRFAQQDRFGVHTLTGDPDAADLIVFFEPEDQLLATDVRSHRFVARYPEKCMLVDPSDRVVPFLPGIYASIERQRYDPARVRAGYFPVVCDHSWIQPDPDRRPRWLYAFLGDAIGIPVRERILALQHPRGLVRDTGRDPANQEGQSSATYDRFHREFADVLVDSAFVLCPRGAGVSTFRLFETMKAGRVPVILSDDWVAPDGPDWPSFALIVAERDVPRIPEILEAAEPRSAAMGRRARAQWDTWFSESVSFHRMVEWCLSIQRQRRLPERVMRIAVQWQLLLPFNLRHKLLPGLRRRLSAR